MPKNVTIYVPDELAKKMEELSEVNWSEVCRKAIAEYIKAREPKKGEIIKNLEEYLRAKNKTEEERRESLRRIEIDRFTKKWGEPDFILPDKSPGAQPPYVGLNKTVRVEWAGSWHELKVWNGTTSLRKDEKGEIKKTDLATIKEKWKELIPLDVAEYFSSIGFNLQLQVAPDWITIEVWTGLERDYIREVSERKDFVLLFASDGEDTVLLGYCEIPKWL